MCSFPVVRRVRRGDQRLQLANIDHVLLKKAGAVITVHWLKGLACARAHVLKRRLVRRADACASRES
jgi:hypothetical protein